MSLLRRAYDWVQGKLDRIDAWLDYLDEASDECSGPDTWTAEDEAKLQAKLRKDKES